MRRALGEEVSSPSFLRLTFVFADSAAVADVFLQSAASENVNLAAHVTSIYVPALISARESERGKVWQKFC